ncbi:MAG TPA: hypothetical protein VK475_06350, partial [Pyrinomonadaceae bacterium]|nr:hypothetical protein [Pyrinomonadaceae bacterium]
MTFNSRKKMLMFLPGLILVLIATQNVASAPILPNPVLYLMGLEPFTQGGKDFIRYKYDVDNKDAYP